MSLPLHCFPAFWSVKRGLCHGLLNRQNSEDRLSALHAVPQLHLNRRLAIEQNIDARAELDKANPLAAGHFVFRLDIEDYAARDEASNLFKDNGAAFALHRDNVLLILFGGISTHRVEKFSA